MTREIASNIQVRLAVLGDAATIASILYQAFVEYEPTYTPEAFAATTPTADQIQNRFDEGPVWVAVQHEAPIGTLSAVSKGEGLYIRSMAILPGARGQGIGELLLQQAERLACQHNRTFLFLSTTPYLTRAIRLYEKFGFQRSDQGPHNLFGTPLVTMIKPLTPVDRTPA